MFAASTDSCRGTCTGPTVKINEVKLSRNLASERDRRFFHDFPDNATPASSIRTFQLPHLAPTPSNNLAPSVTQSLLVLGFSSGVFGLYEMPKCTAIHTLSVGQLGIGTNDVSGTGDWLAFGCARLGQVRSLAAEGGGVFLRGRRGRGRAGRGVHSSPASRGI